MVGPGSDDAKSASVLAGMLLGAVALLGLPADGGRAQEPATGEYHLKAAFLYNLARYVTWPESVAQRAPAPFVFGVLGEDPFGYHLDQALEGRSILERRAIAKRVSRVEDAAGVNVLFVSRSARGNLARILEVLGTAPVLVVGEGEDFAQGGGMIALRTDGRKVRFDINLQAVERAGIKPSSQLLRLARIVEAETIAR